MPPLSSSCSFFFRSCGGHARHPSTQQNGRVSWGRLYRSMCGTGRRRSRTLRMATRLRVETGRWGARMPSSGCTDTCRACRVLLEYLRKVCGLTVVGVWLGTRHQQYSHKRNPLVFHLLQYAHRRRAFAVPHSTLLLINGLIRKPISTRLELVIFACLASGRCRGAAT